MLSAGLADRGLGLALVGAGKVVVDWSLLAQRW